MPTIASPLRTERCMCRVLTKDARHGAVRHDARVDVCGMTYARVYVSGAAALGRDVPPAAHLPDGCEPRGRRGQSGRVAGSAAVIPADPAAGAVRAAAVSVRESCCMPGRTAPAVPPTRGDP